MADGASRGADAVLAVIAIGLIGGIGWFLPLLGVSLLAFFCVDAAIAVVKARVTVR